MKIYVSDAGGEAKSIPLNEGWSLMECIRAEGLPIPAVCGGCCLCSTCHVYVQWDWLNKLPPRSPDELATIADASDVRGNSRLACQIRMVPELDGLRIELANAT